MPNEDLMPNEIPSLWPTDLLEVEISTPLAILKKQATDLADVTHGVLRGRVVTETLGEEFDHKFFIVAPALDYQYELCHVTHRLELYPCLGYFQDTRQEIHSEPALISWLQSVFRSPGTHKILASLISQSRA
jgi:hypothetical protein